MVELARAYRRPWRYEHACGDRGVYIGSVRLVFWWRPVMPGGGSSDGGSARGPGYTGGEILEYIDMVERVKRVGCLARHITYRQKRSNLKPSAP